MNFQENTETNRNPQNATLTLVPALLQTGRSTLAPRHSEYSSRSTILNKGLGVGLAIDVSKVKLHFRVNLWPSFWGPKTLAKPVSPRRASPVGNRAFCGCEQLQRFTLLDWGDMEQWVQAEHNAFFMCDKFEKPHWLELLPAEGPDSDDFDEELSHEYCQYHASPW